MVEFDQILLESEEKYQFLINNIMDIIIEIDLSGTITFVSKKVYDIFGYKPEELVGNQFFNYLHFDDMEKVMEEFKKTVTGK